MKRHTLFLLVITGLTLLNPSLHGEERSTGEEKVTLSVEKRPVTEVLRLIEQQTGYTFSYSPALLNQFPPVTLKVTNQTVANVLKLIFDDTEVLPVVQEQYIILKKRPKPVTISGFIYDRESHESLIAANVYDQLSGEERPATSASTALPFPRGGSRAPQLRGVYRRGSRFYAANDTVVHFFLSPSPRLQELVVEGDLNDLLQNVETGKISLNTSTLKSVPSFMSENDVVKVLQQMPGVAVGTDGMAGLYVRGGNADENLIPRRREPAVPHPPPAGPSSTFNPEAVKTMEFYKGSFRHGTGAPLLGDGRADEGRRYEEVQRHGLHRADLFPAEPPRAYHQGQDLLLHLASAYLPRLDHSLHHAFHEPEK